MFFQVLLLDFTYFTNCKIKEKILQGLYELYLTVEKENSERFTRLVSELDLALLGHLALNLWGTLHPFQFPKGIYCNHFEKRNLSFAKSLFNTPANVLNDKFEIVNIIEFGWGNLDLNKRNLTKDFYLFIIFKSRNLF